MVAVQPTAWMAGWLGASRCVTWEMDRFYPILVGIAGCWRGYWQGYWEIQRPACNLHERVREKSSFAWSTTGLDSANGDRKNSRHSENTDRRLPARLQDNLWSDFCVPARATDWEFRRCGQRTYPVAGHRRESRATGNIVAEKLSRRGGSCAGRRENALKCGKSDGCILREDI